MMSFMFSLFYLQVLEIPELEFRSVKYFQNGIFWTGIKLDLSSIHEFLYVCIFNGIFILFIILCFVLDLQFSYLMAIKTETSL